MFYFFIFCILFLSLQTRIKNVTYFVSFEFHVPPFFFCWHPSYYLYMCFVRPIVLYHHVSLLTNTFFISNAFRVFFQNFQRYASPKESVFYSEVIFYHFRCCFDESSIFLQIYFSENFQKISTYCCLERCCLQKMAWLSQILRRPFPLSYFGIGRSTESPLKIFRTMRK